MQQQEILFRKTTLKLLSRAETLRQSWHSHQTATISIMSTMVNLRQQQTSMTTNADTTINTTHQLEETYAVNTQRLLYKQTQRYEQAMRQLGTRLDQWHTVVIQGWHQLAIDAQHNAAKAQAVHLTNNTGSSNNNNTNQTAAPLSSHSLLQVTSVSPAQALEWILQLEDLYKRQYHCKRMLFLQLSNNNNDTTGTLDVAAIMDQWSSNAHLQQQQYQTLTQDISDRLQLYNHIKKVIEST